MRGRAKSNQESLFLTKPIYHVLKPCLPSIASLHRLSKTSLCHRFAPKALCTGVSAYAIRDFSWSPTEKPSSILSPVTAICAQLWIRIETDLLTGPEDNSLSTTPDHSEPRRYTGFRLACGLNARQCIQTGSLHLSETSTSWCTIDTATSSAYLPIHSDEFPCRTRLPKYLLRLDFRVYRRVRPSLGRFGRGGTRGIEDNRGD